MDASVDGESAPLRSNPRIMRRLVRNLFENAVRYGGQTPIVAEVHRIDRGGVQLAVMDGGPGVSKTEPEQIFAPFYRAPNTPEGGTGFGLALVRQIARTHGGEARCLPRSDGGTRFEISLYPEPDSH